MRKGHLCNRPYLPKGEEEVKKIILAALVCGAMLLGCAEPPPESGTVIDKRWKAEYESWVPGNTICVSYSNGACTMRMQTSGHYVTKCAGGCFWLHLENCDEGADKCKDGERRVTNEIWHQYEVGQHYPEPR